MAFQLSPSVNVTEIDASGIVPAVATSIGGFVGAFQWGPVEEITTISNEADLVRVFGKPNDTVAQSFFSAANFLSYANNLKTVRVVGTAAKNAVTTGSALLIENATAWETSYSTGQASVGEWAAKYPGVLGNSLKVSMVDSASWSSWDYKGYFDSAPATSDFCTTLGATTARDELHVIVIDEDGLITGTPNTVLEKFAHVSKAKNAKKSDGTLNYYVDVIAKTSKYIWWMDHTASVATTLAATVATSGTAGQFTCGASTLAVGDRITITGTNTGVGTITGYATGTTYKVSAVTGSSPSVTGFTLTTEAGVALVTTVGTLIGLTYTISNDAWGSSAIATTTFKATTGIITKSLSSGVSDDAPTAFATGWDLFANAEEIDVNLLITGSPANYATDTLAVISLATTRKDCVVFVSPALDSQTADDVVSDRENFGSSSYSVMDSGWKYQYDKYNDKYRWVPLNADIAGLCARTDDIADPWFSPAGLNRGQIKNVVKLNWNPGTQAQRDTLYKSQVNPVVTMAGQGTVLMGDKTMLTRPSAFDRINVRRLFIVLEKAIATAGKFQLFEFNDAFTRAQFRNLTEPFLRDVQGRRGVYDFKVVCDTTNNTGDVIDANGFVADIFIKPARSINFMQLNFIATRTGVSFTEVAGA